MRRVLLAGLTGLALLVAAGCPADDMPPPPVPPPAAGSSPGRTSTPATSHLDEPKDGPKGATGVTDERATSTDRERLLAMTPEQALVDGLRGDGPGGLSPLLAGEGALAMAEQLRAAQVPTEALDLCVVVFDRAREQAAPGTLPEPALQELQRALKVQAGDQPGLLRWVEALAGRVYLRQDVEAAVAFLLKVREVRALSGALQRGR